MNGRHYPRCHGQASRIVVIGASAGLEVIQRILGDLPADLPAAVFVVMHLGATSHLAAGAGEDRSPAGGSGRSGLPIRAGTGLHRGAGRAPVAARQPHPVAPRPAGKPRRPGNRSVVPFRGLHVRRARHRRGAVRCSQRRSRRATCHSLCGGTTVVQDPSDAAFPDMPESAQQHVDVGHVASANEMAAAARPTGASASWIHTRNSS